MNEDNVRIMQMAIYYETDCLNKRTPSHKIHNRFREFRNLIKRGTFSSILEMEEVIYNTETGVDSLDSVLELILEKDNGQESKK